MLSAVVITHNEERNIVRCLRSLSFCDQVIVVDSFSTDKTTELAGTCGAQVHQRAWRGYADQKNYATSLAKNDWVLSIDADEEVSVALKEEILAAVKRSGNETAYSMPRKTIHSGRWIRFGGWYPNRLVRLYRKSGGAWFGSDVHEYWKTEGVVGDLQSDLVHYSFDGIADQVERNNQYSTLGATQLKKTGQRFSTFKLLGKTVSKFFETYLLKSGFRDGYPGFIIAVSAAYSVFLKWAKLWELESLEKETA